VRGRESSSVCEREREREREEERVRERDGAFLTGASALRTPTNINYKIII
jgi:hypothetical protein